MKKIFYIIFMVVMSMSFLACASNDIDTKAEMIVIQVDNGKKEMIDVEVPFDPQRVVCLNYISIDILDKLGLGDRIVGMIKNGSVPEHLKKYEDNENIANLGGMKDIDMEALMALQPDIILSSDRTASKYNEFIKIAPTVASYIDYKKGFYNGFKENVLKHTTIFNKSNEVEVIIADYDKRIKALKEKSSGKTAILGIFSGGTFNTLGNNGRISIITTDLGFENTASDIDVNHGNISSYELLLAKNPEYIFVLDKDTAVGAEAKSAKEMLDNELVHQTEAYKNNNIIYLEPGGVWYLADGGITSMDIILKNLENSI